MSKVKELILKIISENPDGVPQSSIHKTLGISKSRASEILRELERLGVIVRIKIGNQYIVKATKYIKGESLTPSKVLRLGIVWSSEYPFITPFAKMVKERLNMSLEVIVYPNALSATWSLVRGDVDLVLSPLITQLYAYSLTKSLKIIGGGAYGGSLILENTKCKGDDVASSELSAMDACRAIASKEVIGVVGKTYYFSNPQRDVVKFYREGRIKYFVIWHPLTEKLMSLGLKKIASCSDLGINYCCTLASSIKLDWNLRAKISNIYQESINEFLKSPEKWLEWYSLRVGIPIDILRRGIKMYGFRPYLNKTLIREMLNKVGINLPSPDVLNEALELH